MAIERRTVSSVARGSGAVTPALPGSVTAGDIVILVASTISGGTCNITSNGSITTWNSISGSPVDCTSGEKFYVWWGLYSSGSTGPTITPGSDHCCAYTQGFGGCNTTSPIETNETGSEDTSDTSFSFATTKTTTTDGCLVGCVASNGDDSNTGRVPVMTNTSLSSLTLEANYSTNAGGGGGTGFTTGSKATAGATGTFACTMGAASPKAYIMFALKPAAEITPITKDFTSSPDGLNSWTDDKALFGTGSINFTDSLNLWNDPLTGLYGDYQANYVDPATPPEDALAYFSSAPLAKDFAADGLNLWNDSHSPLKAHLFSPAADGLNLWNDTFSLFGVSRKEFTDSLNLWNDSHDQRKGHLFSSTDSLLLWNDAIDYTRGTISATPITKDFSASPDNLNLWNDPLTGLKGDWLAEFTTSLDFWNDSLAQTHAGPSLTAIEKDFPADDLNNWLDVFGSGTIGRHKLVFNEDLDNWSDSLTESHPAAGATLISKDFAADSLNLWNDSATLFGIGSISFTDALNLWNDTISPIRGILISYTDTLNLWDDSLAESHPTISTTPITKDFIADGLNLWNDSSTQRKAHLAAGTDDLNLWNDTLSLIRRLMITPSDSLNAWDDSLWRTKGLLYSLAADANAAYTDTITRIRGFAIQPAADANAAYGDSVGLATGYRIATEEDSLNAWSDTVGGMFTYSMSDSDGLNSWADLMEYVTSGVGFKAAWTQGSNRVVKGRDTNG